MKQFIKQLLKEAIDSQSDYKTWLRSNAKGIKVGKVSTILRPDLNNMTSNMSNYLKQNNIYKETQKNIIDLINSMKPNECFHNSANAFYVLSKNEYLDVKFVLGMMIEGDKRFGHAWNIVNGKHYDFTAEKNEVKPDNKYFAMVILDNMNSIENLSVFNPDFKCEHKFEMNGEQYDMNGMCSLYPYYEKTITYSP